MKEIFPTLIGNDAVKAHIGSDIAAGVNSHAYIITGERGSGKRTIAKLIAASVSCENRYNSDLPLPCGECGNCHRISKDISGDVVYITRGDNASIGVDVIREMREGLYLTPNDSDVRTYIIEEADKMTDAAQNAFLLTLEEPPTFVMFVLLVEDATKLLETVRSRAQIIGTETFSSEVMLQYLISNEKGRLLKMRDEEKLRSVVSLSNGVIGRALELLSDDDSDIRRQREFTDTFLELIALGRAGAMLKHILSSKIQNGAEAKTYLTLLDGAMRDMLAVKKSSEPKLVYFTSVEETLKYSTRISLKKLFFVHARIDEAIAKLECNVSSKIALTDMILKIADYRRAQR